MPWSIHYHSRPTGRFMYRMKLPYISILTPKPLLTGSCSLPYNVEAFQILCRVYQPQRNASSLPALAVSARRDNGSRSGAAGAGAAGAAPLGGVEKIDHLLGTNTSLGAGHHVHCLYKVQVQSST